MFADPKNCTHLPWSITITATTEDLLREVIHIVMIASRGHADIMNFLSIYPKALSVGEIEAITFRDL